MATKLKPPKKITHKEAEQISVRIIKENKDGSADYEFQCDENFVKLCKLEKKLRKKWIKIFWLKQFKSLYLVTICK